MDAVQHAYFLQHLSALAEQESICASESIRDVASRAFAQQGEQMTPQTFTKLAQVRLKKPIIDCIRFLDPVTLASIKLHIQQAVTGSPGLQLLLRATGAQQRIVLDTINQLNLPLPLLNVLTVMSRQAPTMYEHSIDVALVAVCLGVLQRRSLTELMQLSYIGLYHDIGSLFLDPALIDKHKTLKWGDWRQLYTHPSLGYEVLQCNSDIHPAIAEAVWQHHERIDGSGYPRGLTGNRLSELGRVAAVADFAAAVLRSKPKDYLVTALTASTGKLDDELLDILQHAFSKLSGDAYIEAALNASTFQLVSTVSNALTRWRALDRKVRLHPALEKVYNGLSAVERMVTESGFSTDQISNEDALLTLQLPKYTSDAFFEARHQIEQILRDVHRNKVAYMTIQPAEVSVALGRWVTETERRLAGITHDTDLEAQAA